jgi:uncharacterized protein YjbJ (UPF0337 family)
MEASDDAEQERAQREDRSSQDKVKQAVGTLTRNHDLKAAGRIDEAVGKVEAAVGRTNRKTGRRSRVSATRSNVDHLDHLKRQAACPWRFIRNCNGRM